jgi:signal transduction histidine kinase
MEAVLLAIIAVLLLVIVFFLMRQYDSRKRISAMRSTITRILQGEKKLQIFSKKEDSLGKLAFEINRLSALYGTAQEKYEKEQLAKKQLISNLSHDVRTPLVSVIGYLEAIVQGRISEDQKDNYIETAYEKAIVLKERVNQLFEFVQSDANEIQLSMEKVDACETARQVLIDFLPILESEQIKLDSAIPDSEANILVDKDSFVRILQNLMKNTLTHGSDGKYLGVSVKNESGSVCIDIADKGKGIDREHLPFVFDRLYKADSARSRGGGIGLAIAKELSNKMNGNIEILRSIPGDTVFRITFPEAK